MQEPNYPVNENVEYVVTVGESATKAAGRADEHIITEIFVEPPLLQIDEAIGRVVLGADPYGVGLEFVASTAERSSFFVTATAAANKSAMSRTSFGGVEDIVKERISMFANTLQGPLSMAQEKVFPNPFQER